MKHFAAIVHISVDDDAPTRQSVQDALNRCLIVDLETEENNPDPVISVAVDVESVTYYNPDIGNPVVYIP